MTRFSSAVSHVSNQPNAGRPTSLNDSTPVTFPTLPPSPFNSSTIQRFNDSTIQRFNDLAIQRFTFPLSTPIVCHCDRNKESARGRRHERRGRFVGRGCVAGGTGV